MQNMQKKLSYKELSIKFITGLIIFSFLAPFLFLSIPAQKASAIGMVVVPDPFWQARISLQTASAVTSAGVDAKEAVWRTIVKELAMIFARKLLNKMTQNIVNWANRGFSGNPLFVENPSSFFKDVAKSEIRMLVDRYGYDRAKFPFGKKFALNTIAAYRQQIDTNAAYSLSKVINDPIVLEGYQNDFSVGGWNAFLLNTQYPQNNYVGFSLKATDTLNSKLQNTVMTKAQTVQDTLQKGQGFLSPKLCMDKGTSYNNMKNEFLQPRFDTAKYNKDHPIDDCYKMGDVLGASSEAVSACVEKWNADRNKAEAAWINTKGCKNLVVTTPGGVVGAQVSRALQSKIGQGELAAAMGNSIVNALAAVLDNLLAKGLNSLYSTKEEPVAKAATLPTNWKDYSTDTPGSPSDTSGGKCIDAKGVSTYDEYVEAVDTANNVAYPNGLPSGTSPQSAQTAVCAAYKGRGSCGPGKQEDELIISGLPAPYVTLSIDFLAGDPFYLWSSAVAACEVGVQEKDPNSPNSCIDPSEIGMCIKTPLEEKIISPYQCWAWCIEAGGERVSSMSASCTNTCYLGKPDTEKENMNRDACLERCTKGGGGQNACLMSCNSLYYNSPGGAPGDKPPKDE